jgi:NAD(P)-dependent dehydrogenase (short-subunit alcohol dehydrogenase family)
VTLSGSRILIVGASSGIGRSLGVQAAAAGARVCFAARRTELIERAAAETGGLAVACDVRDEQACRSVVDKTVEEFGGLDILVYSTAIDVLIRLADAGQAAWTDTMATNVIGAALVTAAALPHLRNSGGRAVYLSASSIDRPLPGMGVYAASKGALETMIRGWQAEHPDVAFSNVRVGSALGTGVTDSWDRSLLMELSRVWGPLGYVHDNGPGGPMTVDQAAEAVLDVLASRVWVREITTVSLPSAESSFT